MVTLRWGSATDSGRMRPENEDNLLAERHVFAVADGMGGHRAGEVASALAVDLLRSRLSVDGAGLDEVVAAFAEANNDIYRAGNDNPDHQGMGTTVTLLALIGDSTAEITSAADPTGEASQQAGMPRGAEGSASDEAQSSERVSSERDQQARSERVSSERDHQARSERVSSERDQQHSASEPATDAAADTPVTDLADETSRAEGSASDEAQSSERVSSERDHQARSERVSSERDQQFVLANVGDSRTYLLRHGRLRRITVDHSYVQELVATGHITDDEARNHPRRNIVTRALGIDPTVRVDAWKLPVVRGDRFLLCSDGLSDEVADGELGRVLTAVTDPQNAADELVDLANRQGGRDNITVIVVDVVDGAEPPDPDTELDLEPAWGEAVTASTWTIDGAEGNEEATEFADLAELVSPDDAGGEQITDAVSTQPDATRPVTDQIPVTAGPARRRPRRVGGFIAAVAVIAVLVLAFVILAAWARRGYFVAFDDDGDVVIYRGRIDAVLWFDPTREAPTAFQRADLDEASIDRVIARPEFDSRSAAERFVDELLQTTTTTTTAPTTTTTPTTVRTTPRRAPATSAP